MGVASRVLNGDEMEVGGKCGMCRLKGKWWWLPFMSIYCGWGTMASMSHVCSAHLGFNMELATIVNPFYR